jgi:hypothetical protein
MRLQCVTADDEHVEMLRKGAAAWDRWRSENASARRANTELTTEGLAVELADVADEAGQELPPGRE